ncbi:MAG: polysaccharide deacetylase family protein [Ferruginibacter sp.]|nr:polysaccharide deacetylase family protein [Bacteroidota bacterium]MBX2918271.1 polysaccharide deacetylase family protein [Ferruginibacter sp.]MCB0708106.1 polysaccharide deacetylase family protein [Chitinophagaceae bacterium]MCC7380050.1 polysaccharide deacetylase family protein [Chitinophagaceae bacterium]
MLNFRNTNIFFIALLFVLIVLRVPFYFYLLSIIIYSLIVFWGCINISAGFFIPVVCHANTSNKEIAISFDDGPAIEHTASVLDVLKNQNITATFFCIGNRIAGNENILRQIHNDGHIIGNHSYSHHFWFDLYSAKKMLKDMQQMDAELQRVIGVKPKLFRPPYGVTNPNVKKAIIKGGYTPVGWSLRSMDTVAKDENILLQKICAGIKPGAVFLFHDTCKITLDVLPRFIKEVKKMGYNIVPLDKMLALTAYE